MKNLALTLLLLIASVASYAIYPIMGPTTVCVGTATTYGDSTAGGTWSSSNTTMATINAAGVLMPIYSGTLTVTYSTTSGDTTLGISVIVPCPGVITPATVCAGATTTMAGCVFGIGTWSSSSTGTATIDPSTGVVTGIVPGTTTITFTITVGCSVPHTVTVNAAPFPITGGSAVCAGATTTLSDFPSGGTWSSASTTIASITSTGSVTGLVAGVATISYTASGCAATKSVTVNPLPLEITGATAICAGGTTTFDDSTTGGIWSSISTGIATIDPTTGIITGGAPGTANIKYTLGSGCYVSTVVTVNPAPSAITAPAGAATCLGGTITLSASPAGGTWSSSSTVTVVSVAGIVTSTAVGPATITYTVISGCFVTIPVMINPLPAVDTVTGGGAYCPGGTGVDIGLLASITYYDYQLYLGGTAIGSVVLGGFGSPISFGPIATPGTYIITATDPITGCTTEMYGSGTVSVSPLPNRYDLTGGGTYCAGGAGVVVGMNLSDPGVNYQLDNGAPAGAPVLGTASALTFGLQTVAATYFVIASDPGTGCTDSMLNSVTVSIAPLPLAHTVTGGGNYCTGDTGVHIGLDGSESGVSYALDSDGTGVLTITGTGAALDFGAHHAGTYTIIAGTGCTSAMIGTAVVVANPLPTIYTLTGGGAYCAGSTGADIGLSGSNTGINYWLLNDGVLGDTIAVAGTSSAIDFGLQTVVGIYTAYGVNPATGCTSMMMGTAPITINPLPNVYTVTGGGPYCSGGAGSSVNLSGSNSGMGYQLYLDGTYTGVSEGGTGGSLSFGLQTSAGDYTVVATNTSTGCNDNMAGSATVSVTPLVTPSVSVSLTSGDTICSGTSVTYTATAVNGGATPVYTWFKNSSAVSISSSYTYVPEDHDIIEVAMVSSAACATPSSVMSGGIDMTVFPMPTAISGSTSMCVGATATLTDGTSGGTWTGSGGLATVGSIGGSTGVVLALSPGLDTITYAMGGGCNATTIVTISAVPAVTASATSSCGGDYTLTASGADAYSWSPATGLSCATCATTDINPTATTTYTVTGTNASGCADTTSVTVNGNRISGYISLTASGTIKVWLIQFDPSDSSISALDSTTACSSGGASYFEFDGAASGNYMVKANLLGGTPGTSGYIPTYSLSSAHWDSAATVAHTSATDTMHINMLYGTVPSGPGFIGGYVASGAGKGTSAAPVHGMLMFLLDAATGNVLTYTYTDGSGNYSFSSLGFGTYKIFPEDYQFTTTPSAVITISPAMETVNGVDFKEHTTNRTITPFDYVSAVPLTPKAESFRVYPNPTSGNLNIQWADQSTGDATAVLTDVLGREVFKSIISINLASGQTQVGLDGVNNGVYLLTIKSAGINYTGKLVVEH